MLNNSINDIKSNLCDPRHTPGEKVEVQNEGIKFNKKGTY